MTKRYMLDSNVFFTDYKCLEKLRDNEIYVPMVVIEELCKHKNDSGLDGYNVRKSLKEIEENGEINVCFDYDDVDGLDMSINDNKIIALAKKYNATLISNDVDIRIKARKRLGLTAEEYKSEKKIELGELRKGKHILPVNMCYEMYEGKMLKKDHMYENDFVLFKSGTEVKDIGIVKDGIIEKAKIFEGKFNGQTPRSLEQKLALTHLSNTDLDLVTFSGAAGTAKTMTMLGQALDLVEKKIYNRIYIVKAPIPLDNNLRTGYKKGGFHEKMALPLGSITSNLYNMKEDKNNKVTGMDLLEGYVNFGKIIIISLEDILGMSLAPNSIILIEEAQTLSLKVATAAFSRCNSGEGAGSVIFANGDLMQSSGNNLLPEDTGFFKIINAFAGYKKSAHLTLEDVHRSNFVKELNKRLK